MEERLQKILSTAGVASRRAAEKLILLGCVSVNGVPATLGDKADPEADEITVNGKPLQKNVKKIYIALNKPEGYLTTVADDRGRKTVMDLIPTEVERVYPVGRLDMDSSGLLLLTNDGDFANKIMHPSLEKNKEYRVVVTGDVHNVIDRLNDKMIIDGYEIRPAKVNILSQNGKLSILSIVIHEGRNRQIRKMCALNGLCVVSLERVSVGDVRLDGLEKGKCRYLNNDEINSFN